MKRPKIALVLLLSLSMILSGCGKDKESEKNESADTEAVSGTTDVAPEEAEDEVKEGGILPSKICDLGDNAYIPDGCDATVNEEGKYAADTIYGSWLLQSAENGNETLTLKSGDKDVSVKSLPNVLWFGDLSINNVQSEATTGAFPCGISQAKNYAGLNWGCASNEFIEEILPDGEEKQEPTVTVDENGIVTVEGDIDIGFHMPAYGERGSAGKSRGFGFCYDFSGDKLAIGYLDNSTGDFDLEMGVDVSVTERVYDVEWNGVFLTLTDGQDSATYVPEMFATLNKGSFITISSTSYTGDELPGISGMEMTSQKMGYYDDYYELQEFTDVNMTAHGAFEATLADGSYLNSEFRYSDSAFIFIVDGKETTFHYEYDDFKVVQAIPFEAQLDRINSGWRVNAVNVGNTEIGILGTTFDEFISKCGFDVDVDLSQKIKSGYVTEDITLTNGSSEFVVKAFNPWRDEAALSECEICYVKIDANSGDVNLPMSDTGSSKIIAGTTTYKEIITSLGRPYNDKETEVTYKGILTLKDLEYSGGLDRLYKVTEPSDLWVTFSDGVVQDMVMEYPQYLYCGMQDNADPEVLRSVGSNCFEMTVQVQNDILERLQEKFDEAGVGVVINELTGEVSLENKILFPTNSYDLKAEGKEYIDAFMRVYTEVLLSDEFSDYIDKIVVEGHTDSTGDFDYNMELSENRAKAVVDYTSEETMLTIKAAIKDRFDDKAEPIGRSCTQLIFDKEGNEDRDASRRVTIKFWIDLSKTVG